MWWSLMVEANWLANFRPSYYLKDFRYCCLSRYWKSLDRRGLYFYREQKRVDRPGTLGVASKARRCKSFIPCRERIYRIKQTNNHLNIGNTTKCTCNRGSLYLANSLYFFPIRYFSIWKRYTKYLNISRRVIDFINTSHYIDVWMLLLIFFIQLFF